MANFSTRFFWLILTNNQKENSKNCFREKMELYLFFFFCYFFVDKKNWQILEKMFHAFSEAFTLARSSQAALSDPLNRPVYFIYKYIEVYGSRRK